MVMGDGSVGVWGEAKRGCSECTNAHFGENLTQSIHYPAYLSLAKRVDPEFLTKLNKKVTMCYLTALW